MATENGNTYITGTIDSIEIPGIFDRDEFKESVPK